MKHLFFGTPRRLFGTLELPRRLHARSAAVLLCNPFGEEAIRAHRIYRVLAGQLGRSGYSVMRFDYSGTGDSEGDGAEATLDAWVDDIANAAAELRAASGARRQVAFGLRMGGTLAALASASRGGRLRHLVLWDPVVEGAAYLRELATMHREYMSAEMGAGWTGRLRVSPQGFPDEALGTPIPTALAVALSAIDLAAVDVKADHVTVVTTKDSPALERLRVSLSRTTQVRWLTTSTTVPWNSDEGLNAAVVPMDIVQNVVSRIEEVCP